MAGPGDLEAITRIEKSSFDREAYSEALLEAFLGEREFTTLVAEEDGTALAYATMFAAEGGEEARVVSIAVLPAQRSHGLAQLLMGELEAAARKGGRRRMTLEVGVTNVAAINLYLKLGFRIRGTIPDYYGKGRDALYMEKPLPERTRPG